MDAKALYFDGRRGVEIREETIAPPQAGQITIRARCSLVSPGTEMNVYRGTVASGAELGRLDQPLPPYPLKYGYQTVGKVVAAGQDSGFSVGDRVIATHPHQSRFTMGVWRGPHRMAVRIPDDLSDTQALFSSMLSTGLNGLLDVPPRIGDVVAVTGLGIIGYLTACLLRPIVGRLILIDPLASRRDLAKDVGADAVVSPQEAAEAVQALSDGRGVDIFYEASGAPSALQLGLDVSGRDAAIVVLSYFGSREVSLRLSPEFLLRRQRIHSSMVLGIEPGISGRWTPERRTDVAFEALRAIDVDRLITHRVPFERARDAYDLIDQAAEPALGVMLVH